MQFEGWLEFAGNGKGESNSVILEVDGCNEARVMEKVRVAWHLRLTK